LFVLICVIILFITQHVQHSIIKYSNDKNKQEAQLMLTTRSTRLAVSRGRAE